jgi:hypothetical protein
MLFNNFLYYNLTRKKDFLALCHDGLPHILETMQDLFFKLAVHCFV